MLLDYFKELNYIDVDKNRKFIEKRRMRGKVLGMRKQYLVTIGDIIRVVFHYGIYPMGFTGMCIGIRKKNFTNPDVSLILRNVIVGVGVELIISYYCNRAYNLRFEDHRRKAFIISKSKNYSLREKVNALSKI